MMKKFLFFIVTTAMTLASCSSPSPEQKAKKLMEEKTISSLVKPNSYEFVDMKFDSCFYGGNFSPEMFSFSIELSELYNKYRDYKEDADQAESMLTIYAPSYYDSAHNKQQRRKYQEEFDLAVKKRDACKSKIIDLFANNKDLMLAAHQGGGEFTGFYGILDYKAETNGGMTRGGENLFFFDKEVSKVIGGYSAEDLTDIKNLEDFIYEFEDDLKDLYN